jgi:hypothetical protein
MDLWCSRFPFSDQRELLLDVLKLGPEAKCLGLRSSRKKCIPGSAGLVAV